MISNRHANRIRQWSIGAGLAAASMLAMGTAHADDGSLATDIGLLDTAQTDVTEAFNVLGQTQSVPDIFSQFEPIQTPLLSSDNSFVSDVADALFNGSDQQLGQAGEALLTAADAFTTDPTSSSVLELASAGFGFDGTLLFNSLPANFVGKIADQTLGLDSSDIAGASAAADVATPAAADPATLLSEATTNLTDASQVLSGVPASDTVDLLSTQLNLQDAALQAVGNLDTAQSVIESYNSGALVDLVTPFFTSMDQGWASATETLLNADQALDVALVGGTGVEAAELAVISADLGVAGDAFSSFGTDVASLLF